MTALQAEVLELKANPNRAARGRHRRGRLDRGRGPVATALIQSGTLKDGDAVVVRLALRPRPRACPTTAARRCRGRARPIPVEILGLSGVPQAGDTLLVVADERKARQIATRARRARQAQGQAAPTRITLEDLHKQIEAGEVKELRLVLKADVQGSVEALTESLERLVHRRGQAQGHPRLGGRHHRVATSCSPRRPTPSSSASTSRPSPRPRSQAQAERRGHAQLQRHLRRHQRREGGAGRHARARDSRDGARPRRRCAALPDHQGRRRSPARVMRRAR